MAINTDGRCPCMDPNKMPKQLNIDGHTIAIIGLTEIIETVRELGLSDEAQIKKELIERVRKRNWVPDSAEGHYSDALITEYKKVKRE